MRIRTLLIINMLPLGGRDGCFCFYVVKYILCSECKGKIFLLEFNLKFLLGYDSYQILKLMQVPYILASAGTIQPMLLILVLDENKSGFRLDLDSPFVPP